MAVTPSDAPITRHIVHHADMRRKNQGALLALILRNPGLSSADLARKSGLAPQTVSVLLKGLEEQNVIKRGAALRGRRGQPATPIMINPIGGYGIGIEISWRHIEFILIDLSGTVLHQECTFVDFQNAEILMAFIVSGVERVLEKLDPSLHNRIQGMGLAMPDRMGQNLASLGATPDQVHALENLDLVTELAQIYPFPVLQINDGTSACRAECAYGQQVQDSDLVYIFIGTYVGAGIFVDGRLIEGRSGEAGHLGSAMLIGTDGKIRAMHWIASIRALEEHILAAGKALQKAPPKQWNWNSIEAEFNEWLDDAATGLALTIANSCTVIDFSAAVIDGLLPQHLTARLVERVRNEIANLPITTFSAPQILQGKVGPAAAAIGAANLPLFAAVFATHEFL